MPKESLEFAAQLYLEQKKASKRLRGSYDKEVFDEISDAQKRYDDYVRELATKPEIVNAIPDFARNDVGSKNFRVVSWHVVYLSQNLDVLDELLTLSHSDEVYWPDHDDTVHLLQDKEADVIIEHLKTKGDAEVAWLLKVSNYIQNNRLEKHLDLFIRDNKLRYPGFYYNQIAYFNTPECIRLYKEMAEKEGYIRYYPWLLQLQIQEGWDSIEAFEDEEECGSSYAQYGGPESLDNFIAHVETLPIDKRIDYISIIPAFGNIRAIEWLYEQLDNSNAEYRILAFVAMCHLYYTEITDGHPDFKKIRKLFDYYEENDDVPTEELGELPKFSAQKLQKRWKKALPKVSKLRDANVRYDILSNQPFDLLEMLKETRYNSRRSDLTRLIDDLIIYTGQFFPFDRHAYFDKQDAQLDVWQQYLEENREQFLPGRWVRWGKYLD